MKNILKLTKGIVIDISEDLGIMELVRERQANDNGIDVHMKKLKVY